MAQTRSDSSTYSGDLRSTWVQISSVLRMSSLDLSGRNLARAPACQSAPGDGRRRPARRWGQVDRREKLLAGPGPRPAEGDRDRAAGPPADPEVRVDISYVDYADAAFLRHKYRDDPNVGCRYPRDGRHLGRQHDCRGGGRKPCVRLRGRFARGGARAGPDRLARRAARGAEARRDAAAGGAGPALHVRFHAPGVRGERRDHGACARPARAQPGPADRQRAQPPPRRPARDVGGRRGAAAAV